MDDKPEKQSWMLDELAHAGPEHLDPGFMLYCAYTCVKAQG